MLKTVATMRPLILLFACSLSQAAFATDITLTISGSSPYCGATQATVTYDASDFSFNPGNEFKVELSNSNGSFSSPFVIGRLETGVVMGDIVVNFPRLASGSGYRIRITSTAPAIFGSDNGNDITIVPAPIPTISILADPETTVGVGSVVYLSSTITEGGSAPVYEWKKNGEVVGTSNAIVIQSAAAGDEVIATMTSSLPCTQQATSNTVGITVDNNITRTEHAWRPRASLPDGSDGRTNASGFSIGSKAYVACGSTSSNTYRKDIWEYDPATDVWTQKADLPGPGRYNAIGFSVGNKGYIATGASATGLLKDLWQFDPLNNNWMQRQSLPGQPRELAFGFAIGSKGYVGGGHATGYGDLKDFYEFDTQGNTWKARSDFEGGKRAGSASFAIEGKGFVAGGYNSSSNTWFKDLWDFDQQANVWTQRADMPGNPRTRATGFAMGGSGYVGLGYSMNGYEGQFFQYTLSSNSWSRKPYYIGPTTPTFAVGMAIGSHAYIYKEGTWSEYNLFTTTSFASALCSTEAVPISFDASGFVFNNDNKFIAQMSAQPDFSVTSTLGSLQTNASTGTINAVIPALTNGTYYVRVVSKSPELSTMMETLTITGVPAGHFISTDDGATVCKDVPVTFTSSLPGPGFQWLKNSVPVGTDANQYIDSTLVTGDVIKCVRTYTSGCKGSVGVASNTIVMRVNEPAKPTITISGPNTLKSSGAIAYQWYFNGNIIIGARLQSYEMELPGIYKVRTTDNNGCIAFSDDVVDAYVGLEDDILNGGIYAYPNPFANVIVIGGNVDEANVYDVTGKQIVYLRKGNNDVSQLARGLYMVRLVVDGSTIVRRIVKLE